VSKSTRAKEAQAESDSICKKSKPGSLSTMKSSDNVATPVYSARIAWYQSVA
jgi:hypothetical protein